MLDLDSPLWHELECAGGTAEKLPALLRDLRSSGAQAQSLSEEPWRSLWQLLLKQYEVFMGTYAAVPHLVAAAIAQPHGQRMSHINLAAVLVIMQQRPHAPAIPHELAQAYQAAVKQLEAVLVTDLQLREWQEDEYQLLLAGIAAVRHQPKLAMGILSLK